MINQKFNVFVPIDIEKGGKDNKKRDFYYISGVASDGSVEDSDGEILDPNGFMLDKFIKGGFLNYEHGVKNDPTNIIGEPTEAIVRDDKLYIKGKLYGNSEKARQVYEAAKMLKENGSDRRFGFSIEGKALKRDPFNEKKILKAMITHCAITSSPKNSNTFMDIVKGEYKDAYIEPVQDTIFDESANGGQEYLLEVVKKDGTVVRVNKDFSTQIFEKAMMAGSQTGRELTNKDTSGAALKRESLSKKLINLQPEIKKSIIDLSKNIGKFSTEQLNIIRKSIENFLN